MPGVLLRLSCLGMVSQAVFCAAQVATPISPTPLASVHGRVTVTETINRTTVTSPVHNLTVYLFTMEAGKPFQDLQQQCRRVMAAPRADPVQTYQLCDRTLGEAVELIPRLPATATTQTDRDGSFRFENVAAGRRYQVVGVKPGEGDTPIVVVATTARLRQGESVTLSLSENEPWTGPLIPR